MSKEISLFSGFEVFDVSKPSVFPLPKLKAEYLPLFVSGLTAALALDKVIRIVLPSILALLIIFHRWRK